jgi:hypothetical protein
VWYAWYVRTHPIDETPAPRDRPARPRGRPDPPPDLFARALLREYVEKLRAEAEAESPPPVVGPWVDRPVPPWSCMPRRPGPQPHNAGITPGFTSCPADVEPATRAELAERRETVGRLRARVDDLSTGASLAA